MLASNLFGLAWLLSVIGIFTFVVSAIINLFKRRHSKEDWKRSLIFLVLSVIFLFMIGVTYGREQKATGEEGSVETIHQEHHDSEHHHHNR